MLVAVTGGTGFVGAHSVAALLRRGHQVRLLVRDRAAVARGLAPLGVDPAAVETVAGEVTDRRRVAEVVCGAQAVLHAASVYSFDSRQRETIRRTNEHGTELVLAAARRAGAERIVHVSSVGALFPTGGAPVREDTPVGWPAEPYLASKAAAERIARQHQQDGAPVLISYPPALLGPHDPRLGDQTARLRDVLRGLMPIWPLGGFPVGDVRDTAELHAGLMTAPRTGLDRHFGPGTFLPTRQYVRTLRELTGRRLPAVFLPARAVLPVGRLAGLLQPHWPWHIPAEYGAVYTCAYATEVHAAAGTAALPARSVADTMADTVRWLHRNGRLSDRQAGLLAAEKEPEPTG
ncbi:NAD-dependent epimerase/dehydratase family protein [Saccharothrix sp. ST-888]|uniref:NAD-dependent epimerase/dehydratase family protein n=1 Tax=Saccharothrix sp. ST-888 TaxID=1427391 RepID=UPI0005ED1C12|nr:NAD-dependent epimerase/dehydratase family protein [Saccharothrix sp. ST-888]KJK58378.1 NAD-dependent epimerase [Saccharothrix sp. ST-888]